MYYRRYWRKMKKRAAFVPMRKTRESIWRKVVGSFRIAQRMFRCCLLLDILSQLTRPAAFGGSRRNVTGPFWNCVTARPPFLLFFRRRAFTR